MNSSTSTRPNWLQPVAVVMLFLIVAFAYLPAFKAGYVWDDDAYVTNNPLLTAPDGLQRIWFSEHHQSQYFPLVYTTLRLEYKLWGLDPVSYHTVNILLHALNAVLIWIILRRLAVPGAWLAAALFAMHPVNVESVAWITELKNTQSSLFCLLTMLLWVQFISATSSKWGFYALALVTYLLALFSKTTACTLPVAMVLALWMREDKIGWRRWLQVGVFFVVGLCMALVTVWWENAPADFRALPGLNLTWAERLLVATRAIWFYAGKLVWPTDLAFSYPRWNIDPSQPLQYIWLAACIGVAVLLWRKRKAWPRGVIAAVVFFVATLSPMLGFFGLYTFRYSFVADHYQYVAAIGLFALVAAGIRKVFDARNIGLPARCGMVVALLSVLGSLTWQQAKAYRDTETLWRDTLKKNPRSWLASNNLGLELQKQGKLDEAFAYYNKAAEIEPRYDETHDNIARILLNRGSIDEAMVQTRKAIELNPWKGTYHTTLALCLSIRGQFEEAAAEYRRSLELKPELIAMNNFAWLLATCPNPEVRNGAEAVQWAEQACQLTDHKNVTFIGTLAAAYAEAGRFEDAVRYGEMAQELAKKEGNSQAAERNAQLTEMYRARQPFHESVGEGK